MYPVILADTNLLSWISPKGTVQKHILVAVETEQNNYKKLVKKKKSGKAQGAQRKTFFQRTVPVKSVVNPWEAYPHPIGQKAMDPRVTGGFDVSDCLILPVVVLSLVKAPSHLGYSKPQRVVKGRSFPIPGYGGHWYGQLELKTAPLAHGKFNHGRALFWVWKAGGALGEGNHALCTACICGLNTIKLFHCCTVQNSFLESISVHGEPAGWCIVMAWHDGSAHMAPAILWCVSMHLNALCMEQKHGCLAKDTIRQKYFADTVCWLLSIAPLTSESERTMPWMVLYLS